MESAVRGHWSNLFSNFSNLDNLRVEADHAWIDLAVLDHPEILDAGDWVALHQAYARASAVEGRIKGVIQYILNDVVPHDIKELEINVTRPGVTLADATITDYSKALCRPLLAH